MRLYLFGPFCATQDDITPWKLRTEKVQALLAWLALEAHLPKGRNQIAELLWDGYLPQSAQQSLRTSLYNLRRQIAPLDLLRATNKSIAFDSSHAHF
jgi:DNA-binding SARP family transcriptional activator